MTRVCDIESFLYDWAPRDLAMSWDNVGLLVGDGDAEVHKVLVALDVTEAVAAEAVAVGADLIVAHHPLMNCVWHKVQHVTTCDAQGRTITTLLKNGVSAICMHTNLDAAQGGVNDLLARTMGLVGVDPFAGLGRVGTLPATTTARGLAEATAEALGVHVKWADGGKPIRRLAVVGGAAGDMWRQAKAEGADALLTGEVSHHEALDAKEAGFSLLAAGHYGTEWPIAAEIACRLQEAFPDVKVVRSEANTDPFEYL